MLSCVFIRLQVKHILLSLNFCTRHKIIHKPIPNWSDQSSYARKHSQKPARAPMEWSQCSYNLLLLCICIILFLPHATGLEHFSVHSDILIQFMLIIVSYCQPFNCFVCRLFCLPPPMMPYYVSR